MKILVTGAGGFVGRHLVRELKSAGHEVFMAGLIQEDIPGLGSVAPLDITDLSQCQKLITQIKPDATVHLAGIAHTANSNHSSSLMFDVNVVGAANVSRSMSTLPSRKDGKPRLLLFVSSAFVYGGSLLDGRLICDEKTNTYPRTKYGDAKLTAEYSVRFFTHANFQVYIARPFNHIGPGQDPSFVVPGFVNRIKSSEKGGVIETGDLTAMRDFTDVRDIVKGYRLILEKTPLETVFVFGSGKSVSIQEILNRILVIAQKNLTSKVNPLLLRAKEPEIFANPYLANKVLNWIPEISLERSLQDIWDQTNP